ncbi:hypothetical protein SERLA73DRAFT_78759 [Serpula lacrymans var. lacrymans S7.3]|uniref:Uncharacterized protein n=1 Tax=Serpula lacrymans var. lacrymans (strain S7.3) TaxID=936435 RepID=F8QE89_SERL3|nr:hypothetical protein SERLA73DRAFT_78759 [Serpula lacrymans var. lacrymans S7.3]
MLPICVLLNVEGHLQQLMLLTRILALQKKCLWYRKGKLQSLAIPQPQEDNGEEASGLDMLIDDEHMEETIGEVIQELQEDLFSFIPIAHSNIIDDGENTAGPSLHQNSIVLDDNEDERIEVEHPTAGKVISMDKTLHQRWRREFIAAGGDGKDVEMGEASDPKFFLFASEMDWRVACWAIQDGIGHQSFNWLLSIPGVSDFMIFTNLAYTIARSGRSWGFLTIIYMDYTKLLTTAYRLGLNGNQL